MRIPATKAQKRTFWSILERASRCRLVNSAAENDELLLLWFAGAAKSDGFRRSTDVGKNSDYRSLLGAKIRHWRTEAHTHTYACSRLDYRLYRASYGIITHISNRRHRSVYIYSRAGRVYTTQRRLYRDHCFVDCYGCCCCCWRWRMRRRWDAIDRCGVAAMVSLC